LIIEKGHEKKKKRSKLYEETDIVKKILGPKFKIL